MGHILSVQLPPHDLMYKFGVRYWAEPFPSSIDWSPSFWSSFHFGLECIILRHAFSCTIIPTWALFFRFIFHFGPGLHIWFGHQQLGTHLDFILGPTFSYKMDPSKLGSILGPTFSYSRASFISLECMNLSFIIGLAFSFKIIQVWATILFFHLFPRAWMYIFGLYIWAIFLGSIFYLVLEYTKLGFIMGKPFLKRWTKEYGPINGGECTNLGFLILRKFKLMEVEGHFWIFL